MRTNVLSGIDALILEIENYGDTKLIAARKTWNQFIRKNGKKGDYRCVQRLATAL